MSPTEATQTRAQRGKLYPHTHITKAQESNPQPCFASATSYNLFSCFIRREKVPLQGKEASPEQPQCSIFLKMFRAFTSFSDRTSRIGRQQKETKVLQVFFFFPSDPAATVSCRSSVRSWRPPGDIISRGRKRRITCSGSFIYLFIFARLLIHDERFRGHRAARSLSYSRGHRKSERPAR